MSMTKLSFSNRIIKDTYRKCLMDHCSLLITSGNEAATRDLVNEDECLISVDRLSEADAICLFRKKLPRDDFLSKVLFNSSNS